MQNHYVQVTCDINCEWGDHAPRYRCYVNGELFTERTWIWTDAYLNECLQISAPPGVYNITYELVEPKLGKLTVNNFKIERGPARIFDGHFLEVLQ
jgi:hypothetical protein